MPRLLLACILLSLVGCGERIAPHGSGVARRALLDPAFPWRTRSSPALHLHYLPGSRAAARIEELVPAAEEALRSDLALMGHPALPAPVELFLVDSREQARTLTGAPHMGQAIPGELTAFFVLLPGTRPPFRHEIMHALTLARWGTGRTGSWLSEGVATWAAGSCQGHGVDAIAAGFLRAGSLSELTALADDFWEVDEVRAYITAASAAGYLAETRGAGAVERLWKEAPSAPHPLGSEGPALEAGWREHLAAVPAATLDTALLRRTGC